MRSLSLGPRTYRRPDNVIHWHWQMQNWLARYIGGKPTLEKPTFKTDDAKPDDTKKDGTKPADKESDT